MSDVTPTAAPAAPTQVNALSDPTGTAEGKYDQKRTETAASTEQLTEEELEEIEANGKKIKLNKEQLRKMAQKGFGSDTAFRQAKAKEQETAQVLRALQENPIEVLKHIHGDKLRDMLETYVYENLQQEKLPPEHRKLLEDQKRLQMLEQREREREQADLTRRQMEQVEHYKKVYTQKVVKALDLAGLPKDPEAGERAIKYFKKAFDRGEQVTPEIVAELVREDYQRNLGNTIGSLDEEKILALLGEKGLEKINKAISKRHQGQNAGFFPPSKQPELRQQPQPQRHYITEDEWNSAKRTR